VLPELTATYAKAKNRPITRRCGRNSICDKTLKLNVEH
jgi:hypothetical protein